MNIEAIKSKIRFRKRNFGRNSSLKIIKADLHLIATTVYDTRLVLAYPDANFEDYIKKVLAEEILSKLYDDNREEMFKALGDFICCSPTDWDAMNKARAKLMDAARYNSPLKKVEISK